MGNGWQIQSYQRAQDERLRESNTRHRLLVDSWAQAVWEADPQGIVVADSASWRAYTGQSLDEWLGYGWLDAVHPDDRAYAERQWREAIAACELVNADFRLRAPDGAWRWTNVRAAPVLNAAGEVEKWAGMNIDIDARKRAERALSESEERYRSLFSAVINASYGSSFTTGQSNATASIRICGAENASCDGNTNNLFVYEQGAFNRTFSKSFNRSVMVPGDFRATITMSVFAQSGGDGARVEIDPVFTIDPSFQALLPDARIGVSSGIGNAPAASDGAVPEPASWALMIGGFGMEGTAMRRRRPASAAAV